MHTCKVVIACAYRECPTAQFLPKQVSLVPIHLPTLKRIGIPSNEECEGHLQETLQRIRDRLSPDRPLAVYRCEEKDVI